MEKERKSRQDRDKLGRKIRKQYDDLFSEEDALPTPMSMREVEALKARVTELEAELAGQGPAISHISPAPAREMTVHSLPLEAVEENPVDIKEQTVAVADSKSVGRGINEPFLQKLIRGQTIGVGVLAVMIAVGGIIAPRILATLPLGVLAVIVGVASSYILRRGRFLTSGYLFFIGTSLAISTIVYMRGYQDASTLFYLWPILGAISILEGRGGMVVLIISILSYLTLAIGQRIGFLNPPLPFDPQGEAFLTMGSFVIVFSLLAYLARLSSQNTMRALHQSRQTAYKLQVMNETLENRVADRTHDLELASEVGRTITERVADLHGMLTAAVEMIRARFDLYYTQVYLTDPSGKSLMLRAGTGEVGKQLLQRGHRLPVGVASLNGRAVVEKKPVIVADTTLSSTFLPNPLLPETRSEMAIPLIAGGRVIGVLDVQSEIPGYLNEGNLPAFGALAGQLSVAVQNASLFAQTQEAREQVEANAQRIIESGWKEFLNSIDRSERIGYLYDQNETVAVNDFTGTISPANLSVPIAVTGAEVGKIQAADENRVWTPQDQEILEATATRLGQHIEGLRLLAQAERYRAEAEQAVRQLTHAGWETYLQTHAETGAGYVYDRNEVKLLDGDSNGCSQAALKHALVVRDEAVGELSAAEVDTHSDAAAELIAAVADQLSSHIENLRLSEQNEKRAHEMETVAELSATTSTVLDPDKLLQAVVDLTKESFGVYHAHVYLKDDKTKTLDLTAGAGVIGQKMVAEAHSIRMDAERSLVARAAREMSAVTVNDVRADPGFLPNPLLPETRSEMAIPMIMGDRVLGVFDVQADSVGHFTDEDANIFTILASQVAVALQNARLFSETQIRSRELSALNQIITTASQTLDLNTILETVLDKVLSTIDFSAGLISLFNQATETLELGAISNMPAPLENRFRTKGFDGTLCAYVADTKQSLSIGDLELGGPVDVRGVVSNGLRSYLGVPIIGKGHILGTLCLFNSNSQEISSALLLLVESMAGQLGIAIENARLYAEQSATVTQLRELDRLKSSFLATMSHELRTPLNSILGFADVILEELDGPLTDPMSNDLQLIQKNGQHLLNLINDVLDMAKIEAGKMNLELEQFRIHEILEEVVSITSPLASEKGLSLFIKKDSDQKVKILADRTRLRQVMLNVVNNALKFTEKGKISICAERQDEKILISTRDTGTGIPPDKLEAVFQEFTQVDTSTTRKAGGTGLGLPISRRLIEMHGGRMWAESTGVPGKGSIIYVELPIEAKITEPIEKPER